MTNVTVNLAKNIRLNVLRMVFHAKASHVGSCFSVADILAVLYGHVLKLDPSNPNWPQRDRFILSKGHAAAAVYAALALRGFFPIKDLKDYGKDGSILMTHINHKVNGVEFSTGSLGHGLSFAVGKALAGKMCGQNWRVFVLLSDGELDEGSNWEALMFASHHKLDNLVVIIDYNKLQSLTTVSNTLGLEPLIAKFQTFGAMVCEVDGHDLSGLINIFDCDFSNSGKPLLIVANTIKGKGVKFMENKVEWHYKSPNESQFTEALVEIETSYA